MPYSYQDIIKTCAKLDICLSLCISRTVGLHPMQTLQAQDHRRLDADCSSCHLACQDFEMEANMHNQPLNFGWHPRQMEGPGTVCCCGLTMQS